MQPRLRLVQPGAAGTLTEKCMEIDARRSAVDSSASLIVHRVGDRDRDIRGLRCSRPRFPGATYVSFPAMITFLGIGDKRSDRPKIHGS